MNGLKTAGLLGLLTALLLIGGEALGGRQGLYLGMILAVGTNLFSYFFSDKLALSMYSAQPVTQEQNTEAYYRVAPIVQRLSEKMGLPMPKLWLIPEPSPNAFATGRDPKHASVAFTNGVLQLMDDRELEGVIAHELGHVLHRDILISSVAATIAGAVMMLARILQFSMLFGGGGRQDDREEGGGALGALAMMIVAPIAAMLIQFAISRTREYSADAAAKKYTGTPDGLVSALTKLEGWSKRIPMEASPATAHMFIIKPFSGQTLLRLFSTHPSTADRIARLQGAR